MLYKVGGLRYTVCVYHACYVKQIDLHFFIVVFDQCLPH